MQEGAVAERETVIGDLARIRDIEVGPGGKIFILLEHEAGSLIVRMDPAGAHHRRLNGQQTAQANA